MNRRKVETRSAFFGGRRFAFRRTLADRRMNMCRLLTFLWLVAGTCSFTYWWYNSLLAMPLSEELWTWFNGWFDGQRPGTASDLEFIVVAGIGLIAAYCVSHVITRLASRS